MTATDIVPELSSAAKRRAARAIENVHLATYQKGGIRDIEEKLDEKRTSVAQEIFALARFASEQARDRPSAIALFQTMCTYAEELYKQEHEVVNLREALPTWATLKHNILKGVRQLKLDPAEYRSEGAFRVAVQKKLQALPSPAGNVSRPLTHDEIDKLLSTTVQHDAVRSLVAQIVFECEALKRAGSTKAIDILRRTMDELAPLVDQRKVNAA